MTKEERDKVINLIKQFDSGNGVIGEDPQGLPEYLMHFSFDEHVLITMGLCHFLQTYEPEDDEVIKSGDYVYVNRPGFDQTVFHKVIGVRPDTAGVRIALSGSHYGEWAEVDPKYLVKKQFKI